MHVWIHEHCVVTVGRDADDGVLLSAPLAPCSLAALEAVNYGSKFMVCIAVLWRSEHPDCHFNHRGHAGAGCSSPVCVCVDRSLTH